MNTRIGRSARNFSSKAPSFVLLTKVRLKRDDHSRTSIQTGVDSMLPTMRLVFPASQLTKTPHAGQAGYPAMTSQSNITKCRTKCQQQSKGVRARFASDNISYSLKTLSYSNLLRVGVRNACLRSWAGTQVYVEHLLLVRLLSLEQRDRHWG